MSLLMRHLNDPVPDLNTIRPDIPFELKRIIEISLAKDRNHRYRSAEDMAKDLKRFLATLEPVTTPLRDSSLQPDPVNTGPAIGTDQTANASEPVTEAWAAPQSPVGFMEDATIPDNPIPAVDMDMTVRDVTEGIRSTPQPETVQQKTKDAARPATKSSTPRFMAFGVIGAVILFIVAAGIVLVISRMIASPDNENFAASQTGSVRLTDQAIVNAQQTMDAEKAAIAQQTVDALPTSSPTNPPTDTPVPLTPTPTTPYVLITGIRIENNKYVVDYEVHNFPESPSLHVHMFFNTVPPEQAGYPNAGPWKLTWGRYGDPPFTQYGPANRPASATQMCALVANPNHSVILESGNCFDLPN
jgi:hypothetical protein